MLHAGSVARLVIQSSALSRIGRPGFWAVGHPASNGEDWWSIARGRVSVLSPAHRGGGTRAGRVFLCSEATLPQAWNQTVAIPQG